MPVVPHQVSKPRVLIAASHFSRESGGVEQYCENLMSAHKARGYDVWSLVGKADQKPLCQVVIPDFWKFSNVSAAFRKISEISPEILNLQYVPQCFSRIGISLGLLYLLWKIRKRLSTKLLIVFHEVYEPFLWNKPWRFFPALMQRIQWTVLLLVAHRVVFVTPVFLDRIKKYQPWVYRKTKFIPVPSIVSVYPIKEAEKAEMRRRFTLDSKEIILGTLSKTLHHELRLSLLIDIAAQLHVRGQKCRIHLLGRMGGGSPGQRQEIEAYAREKSIPLFWSGALEEDELSRQLQLLDGYAVMHHDGVSPRNSAFMAALCHGLPVFATDSPQMKGFPEFESVVKRIHPWKAQDAAERMDVYFKSSEELKRSKSQLSLSFYEKYFSIQRHTEKIECVYAEILSTS